MRSFLLREKYPLIKWGRIPDNIFFEGKVPDGYSLAISPSENYVVLDVDVKDNLNGFDNIPKRIKKELDKTLSYATKNKGRHYWLKYTGDQELKNKTSGLGMDLRTNKGYVVWYKDKDIRSYIHEVKETSKELNVFLESLFLSVKTLESLKQSKQTFINKLLIKLNLKQQK